MTISVWPEGISDGLTLPCSDCGSEGVWLDYTVTEEAWQRVVPEKPTRLGVVCLPCYLKRGGKLTDLVSLQIVDKDGKATLRSDCLAVYKWPS